MIKLKQGIYNSLNKIHYIIYTYCASVSVSAYYVHALPNGCMRASVSACMRLC